MSHWDVSVTDMYPSDALKMMLKYSIEEMEYAHPQAKNTYLRSIIEKLEAIILEL